MFRLASADGYGSGAGSAAKHLMGAKEQDDVIRNDPEVEQHDQSSDCEETPGGGHLPIRATDDQNREEHESEHLENGGSGCEKEAAEDGISLVCLPSRQRNVGGREIQGLEPHNNPEQRPEVPREAHASGGLGNESIGYAPLRLAAHRTYLLELDLTSLVAGATVCGANSGALCW